MNRETLVKMNGYLSANYPSLWRKAYSRTARQGWSYEERAVRIIALTTGSDTRMLAAAYCAAGIN